ncbi:MAG: hypothetical protein EPO20_01405 [Betaproteobacteria bacterium]|nr:MAG: hypothetical protein EPO20_01405 [Betaproteobacteria bacterium]
MITKLRRIIASLLVVSIAGLGLPLPAQAGMVGTDAITSSPGTERARIATFLDRADVQAQLQAQGVSPSDVKARVAALTDEEAAQLAGRIDTLPAGGILGLILLVFLVLLITDILGLTKVFPFTRTVR